MANNGSSFEAVSADSHSVIPISSGGKNPPCVQLTPFSHGNQAPLPGAGPAGGLVEGRPKNNLGTVPIFPQGKWDCPLPKPASYSSSAPKTQAGGARDAGETERRPPDGGMERLEGRKIDGQEDSGRGTAAGPLRAATRPLHHSPPSTLHPPLPTLHSPLSTPHSRLPTPPTPGFRPSRSRPGTCRRSGCGRRRRTSRRRGWRTLGWRPRPARGAGR